MDKIKNIEYNSEYIEIESVDKYVYKIPNNNSYVRNLLYKGINSNKELVKNIKYYDKCADICIYPIWVALGFLIYGIATNTLMLDLIMILCGCMAGISLIGTTIFKVVSNRLKGEANNNEHFAKLYEYAISGGKTNNMQKQKAPQNVKLNEYSKSGKRIIQDQPIKRNQSVQNNSIKRNENEYHLNKNQIIQDEEVYHRKR